MSLPIIMARTWLAYRPRRLQTTRFYRDCANSVSHIRIKRNLTTMWPRCHVTMISPQWLYSTLGLRPILPVSSPQNTVNSPRLTIDYYVMLLTSEMTLNYADGLGVRLKCAETSRMTVNKTHQTGTIRLPPHVVWNNVELIVPTQIYINVCLHSREAVKLSVYTRKYFTRVPLRR